MQEYLHLQKYLHYTKGFPINRKKLVQECFSAK